MVYRRQKKSIRIENTERKEVSGKTTKSSDAGFYYSFVTIILFLCLIQVTVSVVLNISKIVSYHAKIIKITQTRDAAMTLNEQLKDNIRNFSNVAGLEAIARNNLKMSGEDEVLVIINTPKEDDNQEEKPALMKIFKR